MLVEDKLLALHQVRPQSGRFPRARRRDRPQRRHGGRQSRRRRPSGSGRSSAAPAPRRPSARQDRVHSQEVVRCHRRYPRTGRAAGCVTKVTQRFTARSRCPQLQEPQTARCVTLVTQARRVGCYRLSLSTPVQVSKAMKRERYRPDAIDGSVVSGTISEGGRWMTRHQTELSRTRECPSLALVLATVFHVSIIFALLWSPPTTSTPLMPEDAIEVTIERQTTSLAAMI